MILLLLACKNDPKESGPNIPPLDLTEVLDDSTARAGIVTDPQALFSGASAEGQSGDIKIYNNRVQFIIQADRSSAYYIGYGGQIIDADIIRPIGQTGRDLIDDWMPMIGLGRIIAPESVEVIEEGRDGGAAVVRSIGHCASFSLLEGALENEGFIQDFSCTVTTDFILEPDSYLLRMESTVEWNDEDTTVQMGDFGMVALEVSDFWNPQAGLEGSGSGEWHGLIGEHNDIALGIFSDEAPFPPSSTQEILSTTGPVMSGFGPYVTVEEGESYTFSRMFGVGPDMAKLSDAWLTAQGQSTESYSGTVESGGQPVAGARVHIIDDSTDAPFTVAFTDEAGRWSAMVPAGGSYSVLATGRGRTAQFDYPEGFGHYSIYAQDLHKAIVLDSFDPASNYSNPPVAVGQESSAIQDISSSSALELPQAAQLEIDNPDGIPTLVILTRTASPDFDDRRYLPKFDGNALWVYVQSEQMRVPIAAGEYDVIATRGMRWSRQEGELNLTGGATGGLELELSKVVELPELRTIDPHSHATPSGDGRISMANRLSVAAANGVDIHVGTDHDHIANYGPLLAAMGLSPHLETVIGEEVSTVLRGHFNIYPALEQPEGEFNRGAVPWWQNMWNTPELFTQMQAAAPNGVIQLNHPIGSSGMISYAEYSISEGTVDSPEHWSSDFVAMEVLNDGDYEEYLPNYISFISRGLTPTAVGVSDSHGLDNGVGDNFTLVPATNATEAIAAIRSQQTVVSRGPFVMASIDGQWAPGKTYSGSQELLLEVYAPDWVSLSEAEIWENEVMVERIPIEATESGLRLSANISLSPESDAHYIIQVHGTEALTTPYSGLPWAMTAAIRIDVDGDGWEPIRDAILE